MSNRAATHPGAILREDILPDLRKTPDEFAREIGISAEYFSRVLREEAPVTEELASKLAERFNNSREFWRNLQNRNDASPRCYPKP